MGGTAAVGGEVGSLKKFGLNITGLCGRKRSVCSCSSSGHDRPNGLRRPKEP